MNVLFIGDFLDPNIGGAERCSSGYVSIVSKFLCDNNEEPSMLQSHTLVLKDTVSNVIKTTVEYQKEHELFRDPISIKYFKDYLLIVSNFTLLRDEVKKYLEDNCKYIILEHDWKCFSHPRISNPNLPEKRNPLLYPNFIAPESEIQNKTFYEKAQVIIAQSKIHAEILTKNLWLNNIMNSGVNIWNTINTKKPEDTVSDKIDFLKDIEQISKEEIKQFEYSIIKDLNPIKGFNKAKEYCEINNIKPHLIEIPDKNQQTFYRELARTKTLIYFPQTLETYSRVFAEAKMLGCKLIVNKAFGIMSEDYYNLNGQFMIDKIREKQNNLFGKIKEICLSIKNNEEIKKDDWFIIPKVSLITTVYKGGKHLAGFLDAFVKQTYRGPLELVVIDANSPENEAEIIKPYLEKFSNIKYVKLNDKKTTMECFNIATDMANGDYIGLCMIDDRIAPWYIDNLAHQLFLNSDVDLVYGDTEITPKDNETIEKNSSNGKLFEHSLFPFSKENMIKNIPGCMPMYRKSLHYKIGGYKNHILHGGDWEFYLNAVRNGSRFLKLDKVVGLYYANPDGLSTTNDLEVTKERRKSERAIFEEYKDIFPENYKQFKGYFDQWK